MTLFAPFKERRLQVVDLVRTFSILVVICGHLNYWHITHPFFSAWSRALWGMLWTNPVYGVYIFFVVSGFLITRLLKIRSGGLFRPDLRDFYSRRVGRIIPLLFLVLTISAIAFHFAPPDSPAVQHYLRNPYAHYDPLFWISILTFWFNDFKAWVAHPNEFGIQWDILWSLSVEEQFYFFYPLVLRRIGNHRRLVLFLFFFVALGPCARAAGALGEFGRPHWEMNSLCAFDLIAMGCLLALATDHLEGLLRRRRDLAFFLCGSGLLLFALSYGLSFPSQNPATVALTPSGIGLGVVLFLLGGLSLPFFEKGSLRPLALPGKLSYGCYLIHPLLLLLIWPLFVGHNDGVAFLIAALFTTATAWLSYRFYEVPLNLWVRGLLTRTG